MYPYILVLLLLIKIFTKVYSDLQGTELNNKDRL